MRSFFRRPHPSDNAPIKKENEAASAVSSSSEEGFSESGINYAFLITALDNGEEAVIESVLRSAEIPYIIRDKDSESWMRVMMGYNIFGANFYVPEDLVDDAAALLVGDEATEVDEDAELDEDAVVDEDSLDDVKKLYGDDEECDDE